MSTGIVCRKCSNSFDINSSFCPSCGTKHTPEEVVSPHSGVVAWILCVFLGFLGAHRFYVGKFITAILMLLTCGGFGIWFVYDYYSIPCRNFTDSQGRYLECKKNRIFPIVMASIMGIVFLFYAVAISVAIKSGIIDELQLTDIAKQQLVAIQEKNIDKAYSYVSPDAITLDNFNNFVKQHPELSDSHEIKFPTTKYNSIEGESANLEAQLSSAKEEKTIIHYQFKKIDKKWKIVNIEVAP